MWRNVKQCNKIPPILKTIQKEHNWDFTECWEFLNPSVTIWGHPVLHMIYIHNFGSHCITYDIYSQFGVTLYYIWYIFTIWGHPVLHIIYIFTMLSHVSETKILCILHATLHWNWKLSLDFHLNLKGSTPQFN